MNFRSLTGAKSHKAARIEAGNTLGISAAGDFTSVGSVLSSSADMKIDAGGSVNILSTHMQHLLIDTGL